MTNQGDVPADWYNDPEGSGRLRYWDGTAWTEHYADAPGNDYAAGVTGQPPSYSSGPDAGYQAGGAQMGYQTGGVPNQGYAMAGGAVGGVLPSRNIIDNFKWVVQQNYANFEGRARRSEYWYFVLGQILLSIAVNVVAAVLASVSDSLAIIGSLALLAISFGLLVPSLAAGVRRLHDTDKSGWMLLLGLIPLVGGIILLVFMATDGTRGPNQYGPSPKYQ